MSAMKNLRVTTPLSALISSLARQLGVSRAALVRAAIALLQDEPLALVREALAADPVRRGNPRRLRERARIPPVKVYVPRSRSRRGR